MGHPNRSKCSSGLWRPEESWRSKVIGLWFGSTNAPITPSSAKPHWIGNVHQSHGWEDCAWHSSILETSDKSKIVIDFLAAEIGVEAAMDLARSHCRTISPISPIPQVSCLWWVFH